jgi:hypothetical protein
MDRLPFLNGPGMHAGTKLTRLRCCGLLVATLGTVLRPGSPQNVVAARCRKKSARCSRKEQCCSKRCKRGFCYPRRR